MGGCCCSPRSVDLNRGRPQYRYCAGGSVEEGLLSPTPRNTRSGLTDVVGGTNLRTSNAGTSPIPPDISSYSIGYRQPLDNIPDAHDKSTTHGRRGDAQSLGDIITGPHDSLLSVDTNAKDSSDSLKTGEEKNSKLNESFDITEEEDVCPTCLEDYDKENPKRITNCGHHFHLSCILEWMERSDSCAVCIQEMVFDETGKF